MSILIKNATIVQENGPHHLEKKDILIEKGIIQKISNSIKSNAKKVISADNLYASIGFFDVGAHSGEPGLEHRETLNSLRKAAAAGGYTNIAIFPNTYPVMDNSTSLHMFKHQLGNSPVKIHPIGALSKETAGIDIAELIDMHHTGAVGFSDGLKSVSNNGLLMRALQYVKSFEGLIIHHPHDNEIAGKGQMHEGIISTSLGLTGIPTMAELSHIERDISLLNYCDSKLLVHLIASKAGLAAIKLAKKSNENLFCSTSYLNLITSDEALLNFESNYKVKPPLRESDDRKALVKGIKEGHIDLICSNHVPLEDDLKKDAFQYTTSGAIGLQTTFSALWDAEGTQIGLENIIRCLTINPRTILKQEIPQIKKDAEADLTLFAMGQPWEYNEKNNRSLSSNSPFIGTEFKTKILASINGRFSHFNP